MRGFLFFCDVCEKDVFQLERPLWLNKPTTPLAWFRFLFEQRDDACNKCVELVIEQGRIELPDQTKEPAETDS